jgi:hypothetical protein
MRLRWAASGMVLQSIRRQRISGASGQLLQEYEISSSELLAKAAFFFVNTATVLKNVSRDYLIPSSYCSTGYSMSSGTP